MSRPWGPGRPGGAGVAFPRGQDGGHNEPAVNPLASSGSAVQLPAIRAREQNGKANGTASRLGITARRWNEPARGAGVRPQKDDDAGGNAETPGAGGNAEARGAGGAHEAETDAELRAPSDHTRRRHEADAIRSRPCARRAGGRRPVPSQLPFMTERKRLRAGTVTGRKHGDRRPSARFVEGAPRSRDGARLPSVGPGALPLDQGHFTPISWAGRRSPLGGSLTSWPPHQRLKNSEAGARKLGVQLPGPPRSVPPPPPARPTRTHSKL